MSDYSEELMMIARTLPDSVSMETCTVIDNASQHIKKLEKALEIYARERERFKHNKPEMTGAYFLSGGYGETDDNLLPQFVRIVPAYGCAWEQVYVKTDKTISYEGS
jgi:hypothetical protein